MPSSYLHQRYVLKSIVGRKGKHCADPNEIVDNYINNEFPDKIVVIKLDLITLEKDARSEIALCASSHARKSPRKSQEKVEKKVGKQSRQKGRKKHKKSRN